MFSLFLQQLVKNGNDPILKFAIIVIRDQQVANAVQTFGAQLSTRKKEITFVCGRKAFYKIFFDTTSCGDHHIHHTMLDEVANYVPDTRGN